MTHAPAAPARLDRSAIAAAAERIAPYVRRTPVLDTAAGDLVDAPVVLKLELLQRSGSFKARGATHRLLTLDPRPDRVVAASGGNHGIAVAAAADALGLTAEVYLPTTSTPAKVAALRATGAVVHPVGTVYAEAAAAAADRARRDGLPQVHPYDDAAVAAGAGTTALELLADAPGLDTVLVAVGGGGLLAGSLAAVEGTDARVVAVEPRACPTLHAALVAGGPVDVAVGGLTADALGAGRIGGLAWRGVQRAGTPLVPVDDADVAAARALLWRRVRVAAEPAGAAALAALVGGAYRPAPGERVGVLVCGGNADPATA